MAKKYDLAVVVGSYEKNGETKKKYKNVGVMMDGEKGPYIIFDRTFNPAGLPNPDNKESIFISLFEPKDQQHSSKSNTSQSSSDYAGDLDDTIPF